MSNLFESPTPKPSAAFRALFFDVPDQQPGEGDPFAPKKRLSAAQQDMYGHPGGESSDPLEDLKSPNPFKEFRKTLSKVPGKFVQGFNKSGSTAFGKSTWSDSLQVLKIAKNLFLSPIKAGKFVPFDLPKSLLALEEI
jgi:hypothetical protein